MKRKLLLVLSLTMVLVITLTLLSGCGSQNGTSNNAGKTAGNVSTAAKTAEPVTIKYWTQASETFGTASKKIIADFEKKYPNITVKVESFPEYDTKVRTAFNSGTEADVVDLYGSTVSFAKGGKILPVPDSVMTKEQLEQTYAKEALVNRLYNGKYYGIPNEINMESPGVMVNLDLVKKAGLTIPDAWVKNDGPASWNELYDFAKKLTIVNKGVMKQAGLAIVGGQEESMFLSLIWQYGGDYRDEANNKVKFNTPEAKKAAQFMINLITGPNEVHDKAFTGRFEAFESNTAAMTIGAPWYAASFDSDVKGLKYQYFNLPAFVQGSQPYFLAEGGWGSMVSAKTKNADAAWQFVKFATEKENQEFWCKTTGAVPSRLDVQLDTNYDNNVGSAQKALVLAQKIAKYGRDPGAYTGDSGQLVWTIVRQNLKPMLQGEVPIDKALQDMESQGNDMISRTSAK